jgi:uncharacterized LabA/DUF88 family protein
MKARLSFFVDGFNLYHSIARNPEFSKYKWLDLDALCRAFMSPHEDLASIRYFTALATWNSEKVNRHEIFIKALKSVGVEVVLGRFKRVDKGVTLRDPVRAGYCKVEYQTFEEKETDVNIAVYLLESAMRDEFDTAIIVSGDSDLVPAIKGVKRLFPAKRIRMLFPVGRTCEELKRVADSYSRIKVNHLEGCQFPDSITLPDGYTVSRPQEWI